jgi:hypothetical protein
MSLVIRPNHDIEAGAIVDISVVLRAGKNAEASRVGPIHGIVTHIDVELLLAGDSRCRSYCEESGLLPPTFVRAQRSFTRSVSAPINSIGSFAIPLSVAAW